MTASEKIARIKAFIFNIERLLGVPKGSLEKDIMQIFTDSSGGENE
jgi:uncharacterized protein (UPF0335 family)